MVYSIVLKFEKIWLSDTLIIKSKVWWTDGRMDGRQDGRMDMRIPIYPDSCPAGV